MLYRDLVFACGQLVAVVSAATSGVGEATTATTASINAALTEIPTAAGATYPDYSSISTIQLTTVSSSVSSNGTASVYTYSSGNSTRSSTGSISSSTATATVLAGGSASSAASGKSTSTSTSARPSNTQACNGHVEFCSRKYSNVTYVAAHNSPFVVASNAASNQALGVTTQLNDGIRALQFETHKPNSTSPMMLCHTSCDELDVGTLEAYLTTVREWLDENRYEVITIIMGNDDYVAPGNYTSAVTNSGMLDYIYVPETSPMGLDGWPTLAEMILSNKRVVMMLDYDADQTTIPWLLELWNYQWQTPFSPTDPSFPCTVQRPPNQPISTSQDRLYLANHNLNVQIDVASLGIDILVPNWVALDNTNANTTGEGTAGETINNCTAMWNRPPNFLLVDYYNFGNFNGSTLAAAAKANNVTYNTASCCGTDSTSTSGAGSVKLSSGHFVGMVLTLLALVLA